MTTTTNVASPESSHRLDGNLGVGSIVFMVIAAAAPLTVVGGNGPITIASGNGAGAPAGYVIASLVMLLFAVGFVTMTPYVKEAGAFFSYVTLGMGRKCGVGTAFLALVAYTAIQAAIYGYTGWAVNDFVRHLGGPEVPWWIYAFLSVAIVAFMGYRHIDLSSKVLGIALVLEIGVVLIMDLAVFGSGGAHGIEVSSFSPTTVFSSGLGVSVLFALTGFIGFEATAVFRDEARDPNHTIPRATYWAVIIIGVFYSISVWALVVGNGANEARGIAEQTLNGNSNMIMDTAQAYAGKVVRDVMQVLLLTSLFACAMSFHNVLARYKFNLSKKGTLPLVLAHIHPVHQSPSRASLVQTVIGVSLMVICSLLGLNPLVQVFGYLASIATVGMVGLMLLTSIAVVRFFRQHPELANNRPWRTRIFPTLSVVALAACLLLVFSNFTLVTGGGLGISIVLAVIPFLAFAIGTLFSRSSVAEHKQWRERD